MNVSAASRHRLPRVSTDQPKRNGSRQIGWLSTELPRVAIQNVDLQLPRTCRRRLRLRLPSLLPMPMFRVDRARARRISLLRAGLHSVVLFLHYQPLLTSRSCMRNPRSKHQSHHLPCCRCPIFQSSYLVRSSYRLPPYSWRVLFRLRFRRVVQDQH